MPDNVVKLIRQSRKANPEGRERQTAAVIGSGNVLNTHGATDESVRCAVFNTDPKPPCQPH